MIWISVDYRSFDWDLFVEEKRERENVDILGLNILNLILLMLINLSMLLVNLKGLSYEVVNIKDKMKKRFYF